MKHTQKTVGQVSTELKSKKSENYTAMELQEGMQENYMKELWECIHTNQDLYENVFYIEVLTKHERVLNNVFRNYFFARKTCPTPFYDQTVWHYNKARDKLTYLWTVPSHQDCDYYIHHQNVVVPDERELLSFVLRYKDGTLLRLAQGLNEEKNDLPVIIQTT